LIRKSFFHFEINFKSRRFLKFISSDPSRFRNQFLNLNISSFELKHSNMSKPMNDDEVLSEMKKMVAFIKQEANEKVREIRVKADEEFAVEKGKIVRQEAINLDGVYEKKRKQVEVQRKIAISNQTNVARLKVLQKREDFLNQVFEEARSKLTGISDDKEKYKELLRDLILQAFFSLMDKNVTITCRSKDQELVSESAGIAADEFEKSSGFKVDFKVKEGLSNQSSGGIVINGFSGKIKVDNTIEERLRILEEKMLPEIRENLFGKNENRKFYT